MISARSVSLFVVLLGTWLLLSGHWDPLLVGAGVLSSLLVTVIAHRMDLVDHEGHPIHLSWRVVFYYPWLFWQIAKSNLDVARRCLSPRLDIDPATGWLDTSQDSTVARVTYANSITLTPGTVALYIEDDRIRVHALNRASIETLKAGEMDRRVTAMEGPRALREADAE